MIDIDHFKKVNDTYGHLAGDEALKDLTGKCSTILRATDLFARLGGEEFAVLMPETGLNVAEAIAERIRKAISEITTTHDNLALSLTVSIGVSEMTEQDKSVDMILLRADDALYKAKRQGRNLTVTL